MEELLIIRRDIIPTDGTPISLSHFSNHIFPFNTLPLLETHLHPKFVIFDAGRKLAGLNLQNFSSLQKLVELNVFPNLPNQLSTIADLYRAWILQPPAEAQEDPAYTVPDDDANEDEGNRTASGRGLLWPRPIRQKTPVEDDSDNQNNTPPRRLRLIRQKVPVEDDSDSQNNTPPRRLRPIRQKTPVEDDSDSQSNTPPRRLGMKRKAPAKHPNSRPTLSKATLSTHNQQLGEAPWTDDLIRKWSKSYPKKRKLCK